MSTITVAETEKSKKLDLTTSPHLHSSWTTKKVMWFVVAALAPTVISSFIFFGIYQVLVILTAVFFANATEAAIQHFRKKKVSIYDGSAMLTGLLLALTLPPNFSLSATALGAVVAIGLGKQIFGGLGFNIFNPALVGRAFLQAAFPVGITTWTIPNFQVDSVTSATPLAAFKFDHISTELFPMLAGNIGGSLGETSAIALLAGGLFLIAVKIVNWRIPAAVFSGVLVFGAIFWLMDPLKYPDPLFHLLSGGLLLGTFFMATDWVTSPVTNKGMWIFGIGVGVIVVVIRLFGGLPEGVMYSILIMNGLVPIINRFTQPTIFGLAKGVVK
jgi:Na+-translocating ferredoxin:NAD+ oxidoreductase subunit D